MLQRYLLLWLVISSMLALVWPALALRFNWGDPFLASKPLLNYLVAITMFSIGLMLPRNEVRQVGARWPAVLGGVAIQFAAMPLLAYAMGCLLGLEGVELAGMVMVGCVPGAMASNVLTLNARGNASYSVSLTTLATLVSPLATPALLWLYLSESVEIDYLKTCYMLLLTVVAPVVGGHLLSRLTPQWERSYRRVGPIVANLAILWIIAVVIARNRENLETFDALLLLALLVINVGGYLAGYGGALAMQLPGPMRRALTMEVGMQNAGLGAVLAGELFSDPKAAMAPALYMFGCMLTGTILAQAWAMRDDALAENAECRKSNVE